jgi:hypothetical protein
MIAAFTYLTRLSTTLRWTALALFLTTQAGAVDLEDEESSDEPAEDVTPEDDLGEEEDDGLDDPAEEEATEGSEAKGDATPPGELPAKFLIGARYRILVVPQFLINMFGVQGGRTVVVHGGGPEFAFAQKDFEIILSPWFAGYSLESTPFKGPNDGPEAWEFIESYLSMAYITSDFLWKTHVSKQVDFTIGAGVGIGIVFGDFYRNDAYWTNGTTPILPVNGDPYNTVATPTNPALAPCAGPGVPTNLGGQCPPGGEFGAASAWPVYPWLTFQTGLRWSPHRNFIGRLDLGAGSSGFWFGIGADYGI